MMQQLFTLMIYYVLLCGCERHCAFFKYNFIISFKNNVGLTINLHFLY